MNIDEFDAFAAQYRPPRARSTDPQTSHIAAASVRIRDAHIAVYRLLRQGPATDEDLVARAAAQGVQMSASGIRSRRCELVRARFVRDSGQQGRTAAGRPSTIWEVTDVRDAD